MGKRFSGGADIYKVVDAQSIVFIRSARRDTSQFPGLIADFLRVTTGLQLQLSLSTGLFQGLIRMLVQSSYFAAGPYRRDRRAPCTG